MTLFKTQTISHFVTVLNISRPYAHFTLIEVSLTLKTLLYFQVYLTGWILKGSLYNKIKVNSSFVNLELYFHSRSCWYLMAISLNSMASLKVCKNGESIYTCMYECLSKRVSLFHNIRDLLIEVLLNCFCFIWLFLFFLVS